MARGPKPKDPRLAAAQGFPGRNKSKVQAALAALNAAPVELIPDVTAGERFLGNPPAWLTERGRALWEVIEANQAHRLVIKQSDRNVLARYVDMVAQWLELRDSVGKKITYTAKTLAGGTMRRVKPEYKELQSLARELRVLEDRLALNPAARLAVSAKMLADTESKPHPPTSPAKPKGGPIGILKASATGPTHPPGSNAKN